LRFNPIAWAWINTGVRSDAPAGITYACRSPQGVFVTSATMSRSRSPESKH
jgi:hypothetical protein